MEDDDVIEIVTDYDTLTAPSYQIPQPDVGPIRDDPTGYTPSFYEPSTQPVNIGGAPTVSVDVTPPPAPPIDVAPVSSTPSISSAFDFDIDPSFDYDSFELSAGIPSLDPIEPGTTSIFDGFGPSGSLLEVADADGISSPGDALQGEFQTTVPSPSSQLAQRSMWQIAANMIGRDSIEVPTEVDEFMPSEDQQEIVDDEIEIANAGQAVYDAMEPVYGHERAERARLRAEQRILEQGQTETATLNPMTWSNDFWRMILTVGGYFLQAWQQRENIEYQSDLARSNAEYAANLQTQSALTLHRGRREIDQEFGYGPSGMGGGNAGGGVVVNRSNAFAAPSSAQAT